MPAPGNTKHTVMAFSQWRGTAGAAALIITKSSVN